MRALWIIGLALLPCGAVAQDDGKDFLTAFLEQNLSSAGRTVTISGFEGALRTKATMAEMTIADDQGIWLTLRDVTLDWSQSALLSGQIVIDDFSADEIVLDRLPVGDSGAPTVAPDFSLPDLPVSIDIERVAARRIVLGASVLGQAVEGQLSAQVHLADGQGAARLDLSRTDGVRAGRFLLDASFARDSGQLDLTLRAIEDAGGVAVSWLGVPGAPAAAFQIAGSGKVSDFAAEIDLSTDGVTRLGGQVRLTAAAQGTGFSAELSGDPAPVFLPQYAAFFGPGVTLQAEGQRFADGRMDLSAFSLTAQALRLSGNLSLDAAHVPQSFVLMGSIGLLEGPVVLPLATEKETRLKSGTLSLIYDRSARDDWQAEAVLMGLDHQALAAESVILTGGGTILHGDAGPRFSGAFDFAADGLRMADPGLALALGTQLTGRALLGWQSGQPLTITDLGLQGAGFDLTTTGTLGDLAKGLALTGTAKGRLDDLSRLNTLTGRSLDGAAAFDLAGTGNLWTGFADVTGDLRLTDLRDLNSGIRATLAGKLRYLGQPAQSSLAIDASASALALGQREADLLLAGQNRLTATLDLTPDGTRVQDLTLSNRQMRLTASGRTGATETMLTVQHRILDLGLLYPLFPGALTSTGTVTRGPVGYVLDLTSTGPGQITAKVAGRLTSDLGRADLTIAGTAEAGLANKLAEPRSLSGLMRFDLTMQGPIALTSLSGPVTLSGGRLADPGQKFGLTDLTGTAYLSGGQARVAGTGKVTSGGSVAASGSVGLNSPYVADLALSLNDVGLRDPALYTTRVEGDLTLRGPVAGAAEIAGTVNLGRTELRIPQTVFSADGGLPGLQHVGESGASRATRARAGLAGAGADGGSAGRGYALNLRVNAPGQVFIRGRGLDAELGGALILRGRSDAIVPSGAFNLIRGRLDILGRRLNLSQALLQLQGALVPFVRIVATVDSDGIAASVLIEGAADDPRVSFTAVPSLPQEEVLARLLFDRGLDRLTAFQAIQLAGAVATLAGRGGEGVIGRLRQRAGVDNLDVTQDATGATAVTVGKYISDKAYTEATVGQGGKSAVSINLDLAPHITLKGRLQSDGETGIGVFLQRDY